LICCLGTQWAWSHTVQSHVTLSVLHFIFCFCKGLKMMGSDKIHTASHTYVHVLSLCHLYPLWVTWRIQMRTFKRYFSHVILLTTLHLREMN
jgi:hypothetical protein